MEDMLRDCYERAKKLLKENAGSLGLLAGKGYKQVWGRDGLISSLGMCSSGDQELINLAKLTIDSLAAREIRGQIPNFFTKNSNDYGEMGCIDSSLWYPIAVYNYWLETGDKRFLSKHYPRIKRCMGWIRQLDINKDGFIEVPECSDWMDLLARSGRVFYDEVLHYAALVHSAKIAEILGKNDKHAEVAEKLKEKINTFFWYDEENLAKIDSFGSPGTDYKYSFDPRPYYVAEIGFRRADLRCDVYANLLAIHFGVAGEKKAKSILDFFAKAKVHEPYPVKVLVPPILKTDPDWPLHYRTPLVPRADLMDPGNFHNGGIWPYVGGFYVLVLAQKDKNKAKRALEKLAAANKLNKWEFNEWLTPDGMPRGNPGQSWNAAMYMLAYKRVQA